MEALLGHSAQPAASGVPAGAPLPAPATLKKMADAIRALSMDAVQQANSGHPGMPMGMAEIAVALWSRHLKHNPANPHWPDRDRFVLSNGHGSMLLYSVLHLTGYALPIDELRNFRQLHSMTPGHPEVGVTPGVETTTGPLGQGLANAVGMALAERLLAARFNRDGFPVIDHFTWVFAGDGCLMEGISHEACSLAGTLKLSRLVVFYDDNGISIDGRVEHWFRDDTVRRFEAYGWHVIPDIDGYDVAALDRAIALAREWGERGRDGVFAPTLIQCRTMIGKGSPGRVNTAKAHGEPLGKDEIAATRAAIDWPYPPFEIPPEVRAAWDARDSGARAESSWRAMFERYSERYPAEAHEFERRMRGDLPAAYDEAFDIPSEEAFRATLMAQNIVLRESGVADVVDPLAGSYYVEWLTERSEQEMRSILKNVEALGGMVSAIEAGVIQQDMARQAYAEEQQVQCGRKPRVGVNCLVVEETTRSGQEGFSFDATVGPRQVERLRDVRSRRDSDAVERSLEDLQQAARHDEQNLVPHVIDAVRHKATTGEIAAALRAVFGTYRPPSGL